MNTTDLNHGYILFSVIPVILLLTLSAEFALGQNARVSGGYSLWNYSVKADRNPDYGGEIGFTQKGLLHAEMEQIFRHRFFLGVKGAYLIHNRQSAFTGGPVHFNQLSFDANLGLQWDRIGIYAGVNSGYMWDLSFKGILESGDDYFRIDPAGEPNSLFGGLHIGARYYLFRYLRLEAEFRNSGLLKNRFLPDSDFSAESVLSSVQFNPVQFSVGFSLSIPIRTGSRSQTGSRSRISEPFLSTSGAVRFRSPVDGPAHITSPFGRRWGRLHEGVDIDARKGDRILAVADGVVIEAKTSMSYGQMVVIRHGNAYSSYYTHLSRINVRTGDRISAGDVVGLAGDSGVATGVHLHFELRRDGTPVDPERYIRF